MRKQILIFGHDDTPQFIDIYNQYTLLFDKTDFEVTVVYMINYDIEETKNKTLAENCIFLDIPKNKLRHLKVLAIRKMLALTRQKRFEIVICHRFKPTYIMMWVSKFETVGKLISIMHELGTMRTIQRQLAIALLAPKKMILAGVSNAVRDDIKRKLWWFSKKKLITLYNMIDIELTEPQFYTRKDARDRLGLDENVFLFANLGRLVKNKDHATLITSFSQIKPDFPNAKLIIMGTGKLERKLKQQVERYGLTHDVIFTGFVDGAFRYIKAFDCFVLSSVQEAFGRVLLEVMTAKVPIIASKAHGIPEVLGRTGTLVAPRDVKNLASAMRHIFLLSSEEKQQQVEAAYHHVITQFSIPVFQRGFSEVEALFDVL